MIGASSCWLRATAIKTSSPATSTLGAWLAGYALLRRTSRRIQQLAAPPPPPRRHAIHPSAWKGYSANFALTEFSGVRELGILRSPHSPVQYRECPGP